MTLSNQSTLLMFGNKSTIRTVTWWTKSPPLWVLNAVFSLSFGSIQICKYALAISRVEPLTSAQHIERLINNRKWVSVTPIDLIYLSVIYTEPPGFVFLSHEKCFRRPRTIARLDHILSNIFLALWLLWAFAKICASEVWSTLHFRYLFHT